MAASDPSPSVATPTGALHGVATFSYDGTTWQPASVAGPSVATPTGVLRGVAPFTYDGTNWQPLGQPQPNVATPMGALEGVAVHTWSGTSWTPPGGSSTPTGALRGVAAFNWDGSAWQPAGQAGPTVATPYGVLDGVAMFNATAAGAVPAPTLDLNFMTPGTMPSSVTLTRASTATYFDAIGTMQTAAANVPRQDYDPVTHALRGLLIEEARTNVLLNSATLGTQSVAVTAQAYTLSFYGTGTITKSGTATGALVGTGAFPSRVSQTFTPTAGTLTLTVTGSVLSAQLEAGSFATSYIPTTSATATRAADQAYALMGSLFNAATGAVAGEWDSVNSSGLQFGLSDGSYGNSGFDADGGNFSYLVGGAGGTLTGTGSVAFNGTLNKTAFTYGNLLWNCAVNGTVNTGSTTFSAYPWTLRLSIGCSPWGLDNQLDGHVRRIRFWPRVLSNTELQQVTT